MQAKQNESKYIGVSNNDLRDSKDSLGSKDTFGSKSSSGYGMLYGSQHFASTSLCLHAQPFNSSTLQVQYARHRQPVASDKYTSLHCCFMLLLSMLLLCSTTATSLAQHVHASCCSHAGGSASALSKLPSTKTFKYDDDVEVPERSTRRTSGGFAGMAHLAVSSPQLGSPNCRQESSFLTHLDSP